MSTVAVPKKLNVDWPMLEQMARRRLELLGLPEIYSERLEFELAQISNQGANSIWLNYLNERKKFASNPSRLVLPWLLKMLVVKEGDGYRPMTEEEWLAADPVATRDESKDGRMLTTNHYRVVSELVREQGKLPVDIVLDPDKPDIDLDCLPEARDELKEYAARKYDDSRRGEPYDPDDTDAQSEDKLNRAFVCSVGTWTTYKFRSALIDVHKAYGHTKRHGKKEILDLTTNLPDDVDELPEGGFSVCKGRVHNANGEEVECGVKHNLERCPKCNSDATEAPTIGKLLAAHENLREFNEVHPDIVECAMGLIGRIKTMGMHAGAIIIADRNLYGNIPLNVKRTKIKGAPKNPRTGHAREDTTWISMWTEGRNTQLSKFGFIKWDILGLKNLKYIVDCCNLIRESTNGEVDFGEEYVNEKGVRIRNPIAGWDYADPHRGLAGYYNLVKFDRQGREKSREKVPIGLNDKRALAVADGSKTDGIFQFDTPLAKEILRRGVNNFEDLMLFNAMGHPGPMDSIPDAVANRDSEDPEVWRDQLRRLDPIFLEVLGNTYGQIVYQEQLAAIWQRIAGFTAPEAQDARKAVAKKWKHLLKPIEAKWMAGASRRIGEAKAKEWWDKMVSFGRYAFNRSHAVAYCLTAYKCLWLKAYYPAEWWAAVMTTCHPDKLTRYIAVAKSEKEVQLGPININHLTYNYTVTPTSKLPASAVCRLPMINQGLIGIKGIGEKAARLYENKPGEIHDFRHIDEFVQAKPRSKRVMERLIKLGSFCHLHPNRQATWIWYLYKHASESPEVKKIRAALQQAMMKRSKWNEEAIKAERKRLIDNYRIQYPKRTVVPKSLLYWQPKIEPTLADVERMVKDFTITQILDFERQYVGYYFSNPMGRYIYNPDYTIAELKDSGFGWVHAIVTNVDEGKTKKGDPMCRVKLNDGQDEVLLLLWSDDIELYRDTIDLLKAALLAKEAEPGVAVYARYSRQRDSCTLARAGIKRGVKPVDHKPLVRLLDLVEPKKDVAG